MTKKPKLDHLLKTPLGIGKTFIYPKLIHPLGRQKMDFSSVSAQNSQPSVPSSWSSIEELIGESVPPQLQRKPERLKRSFPPKSSPQPSGQKQSLINVKQSLFFPPGISIDATGEVISSTFANQPEDLQKLIQQSLKAKSELKEKMSRRKAAKVEPISTEETEVYKSLGAVTELKKNQEEEEEDKTDVVELLSREVYHLIRQRLAIAQERYGSFYSGRLPW